ncbi:hypothetical protein RI367_003532 [Sorochytrium milnesiophthora]
MSAFSPLWLSWAVFLVLLTIVYLWAKQRSHALRQKASTSSSLLPITVPPTMAHSSLQPVSPVYLSHRLDFDVQTLPVYKVDIPDDEVSLQTANNDCRRIVNPVPLSAPQPTHPAARGHPHPDSQVSPPPYA